MTEKKTWGDWGAAIAAGFIAGHEGCRLTAYRCPAGVWTIGYGHTAGVKEGDKITKKEANNLFAADLALFQSQAAPLFKVKVTRGQFIALLDFLYNVGQTKFSRSSPLRLTNAGAPQAAADAFLLWTKPDLPGIRHRRNEERRMYLSEGMA